mgnify:CR=1 FL=1
MGCDDPSLEPDHLNFQQQSVFQPGDGWMGEFDLSIPSICEVLDVQKLSWDCSCDIQYHKMWDKEFWKCPIWAGHFTQYSIQTCLNSQLVLIFSDLILSGINNLPSFFLRKNISINLLQKSKLWIFEIGQALIEKLQIASQSHLDCCWSHHSSNQSRNVAYFITRY